MYIVSRCECDQNMSRGPRCAAPLSGVLSSFPSDDRRLVSRCKLRPRPRSAAASYFAAARLINNVRQGQCQTTSGNQSSDHELTKTPEPVARQRAAGCRFTTYRHRFARVAPAPRAKLRFEESWTRVARQAAGQATSVNMYKVKLKEQLKFQYIATNPNSRMLIVFHARMARRAQHPRCSLLTGDARLAEFLRLKCVSIERAARASRLLTYNAPLGEANERTTDWIIS